MSPKTQRPGPTSGARAVIRPGGHGGENRREFGRDGISGLVTADRAVRAREVSRPGPDEVLQAGEVLGSLLARAAGRRR